MGRLSYFDAQFFGFFAAGNNTAVVVAERHHRFAVKFGVEHTLAAHKNEPQTDLFWSQCRKLVSFFKGKQKFQPSILFVSGADGAVVEGYGIFHNRQAQAGAARLAGTPFANAVKTLEQAV